MSDDDDDDDDDSDDDHDDDEDDDDDHLIPKTCSPQHVGSGRRMTYQRGPPMYGI